MSRTHDMHFKVTEEEYKNIKANADKLGMKVYPYIRKVAQNPTIINFNYSAIREHTKQISQVVNSINRIIFTIDAMNYFLPKEIEAIADYIKYIWETENKLLDTVRKQWDKSTKKGRKTGS